MYEQRNPFNLFSYSILLDYIVIEVKYECGEF